MGCVVSDVLYNGIMRTTKPRLTPNRKTLAMLAREGYSPAEIAATIADDGQLGLDDLLAGYWRFVRWFERTDGREGWEERAEVEIEAAAVAARQDLVAEVLQ
jgi:hypothetical protein